MAEIDFEQLQRKNNTVEVAVKERPLADTTKPEKKIGGLFEEELEKSGELQIP